MPPVLKILSALKKLPTSLRTARISSFCEKFFGVKNQIGIDLRGIYSSVRIKVAYSFIHYPLPNSFTGRNEPRPWRVLSLKNYDPSLKNACSIFSLPSSAIKFMRPNTRTLSQASFVGGFPLLQILCCSNCSD